MEKNDILWYKLPDGEAKVEVVLHNETIWATQAQLSQLFDVHTQAISKHLKNIYAEEELSKGATCSKMEQVRIEGSRRVSR